MKIVLTWIGTKTTSSYDEKKNRHHHLKQFSSTIHLDFRKLNKETSTVSLKIPSVNHIVLLSKRVQNLQLKIYEHALFTCWLIILR